MRCWPGSLHVAASATVLAAVLAGGLWAGCQADSEAPNAYWGLDGGVPGAIGQPCRGNSRCNDTVAVCIDEDENDTEPPYCRAGCDVTATNDPCGAALLCVGIQNQGDNGACLPAPLLGEPCTTRCDDDLECIGASGATEGTCTAASEGEGEGEGEGE